MLVDWRGVILRNIPLRVSTKWLPIFSKQKDADWLYFWILLQCPSGNQWKICSEVLPNLIAKVEIKVFFSCSVFASEKLIAFQWQCTKIWSTEVIQLETTRCCSCLFSLPPLSSCHSEEDFHWKEMLARLSRLLFNWLRSPETKTQEKFPKLKWQWCKKAFPPSPSLSHPCMQVPSLERPTYWGAFKPQVMSGREGTQRWQQATTWFQRDADTLEKSDSQLGQEDESVLVQNWGERQAGLSWVNAERLLSSCLLTSCQTEFPC